MQHSFIKHKFLSLCLIGTLCTLPLSSCGKEQTFAEYTHDLFLEELTANTLNLHYSLEDPSSYGIDNYEISLSDFSKEARETAATSLLEKQQTLATFPYYSLTTEEKLTFDILWDYLDTQRQLAEYDLYQEPLRFSGGTQLNLPILYAEYEFHNKQDVKEYLELLALTDEYYAQIMDFEKEKSSAGMFMSDELCQAVIDSCKAFLENTDEHYLITTFENRIQTLNLTEKEKSAYIEKNKKILNEQLFPAYQVMIQELSILKGTGKNENGLCYFKDGKKYYERLVYAETGCDHSVDEIFHRIETQRMKDLIVCANLQEKDATIFEQCAALELETTKPEQMLHTLQQMILEDFPTPPDTTYKINYVDPSLEEYLAPAFYIVAPLDNYEENVIYINNGQVADSLYTFTTMAHEGYPGHLYQTVMSYAYALPEIRSILNYSGYVEGWATYIEMMSYDYAGIDKNVASMLSHNQSATLSLYASSDIGLHYYGWTKNDMYAFWGGYGFTDKKIIDEITRLILSEPGNYLKYYVGYIEFLDLLEDTKTTLGKNFNLKQFHKAILDIGPAPFAILEEYFEDYY